MYYNTNYPCEGTHGPKNYDIIETHEGYKFINYEIKKTLFTCIAIQTTHVGVHMGLKTTV